MKKSKLTLFPLAFLVLSGCVGGNTGDQGKKLDKPELSINNEANGLSWAAVADAVSYSISVNDGAAETVTTPGYTFATEAGSYSVKVVANAADSKNNSEAAEFTYTTAYTALGTVTVNDGVITWTGFAGTSLAYTVDGGTEVAVDGNAITCSANGVYTLTAKGGYSTTNNKYYVDDARSVHTKSILVSAKAAETIDLELGDEDSNTSLQEKYVAQKYTSSWETSAATLTLDNNNEFSPTKAVRANVYNNGTWFKWRNDSFQATGSVDYLTFYAKATAPATTSLYFRFEVTQDLTIAGLNFKGVYLTYAVDSVPSGWKHYVVGMDDAKWSITYNGSAMAFADVKALLNTAGFTINSLGDLFPFFGSFQVLARGVSSGNGPKAYVYFDEVKLGVGNYTAEVKDYTVHEYGWSSDMVPHGLFRYVPDGESFVRFKAGTDTMTIPVTVEPNNDGSKLTIRSVVTGADFVAVVNVTNNGQNVALDNVVGTAAPYMAGMTGEVAHVMFDFENFTGSGVGLDGNHKDPSAWTGLRSHWYSDYYSNSTSNKSEVGGNGWSMMGSSDYLDLSTQYAHTGNKSMRLKYNQGSQMRFITWDCTQAPSPRLPKATYMSMWVRACASRDNVLKVRAVRLEQVKSDNHSADGTYTTVEVTIPKDENNGWVEVKIPLNPDYNYYGLAILPVKGNGATSGDGQYFYVDDICLYNTVSPF